MSSLMFRAMLTSLGLKRSFAIYTAIDGVLLLAAWFMISERRPPTLRRKIIWIDVAFFRDPVFWSYGLCFFFTVLYVSSLCSERRRRILTIIGICPPLQRVPLAHLLLADIRSGEAAESVASGT